MNKFVFSLYFLVMPFLLLAQKVSIPQYDMNRWDRLIPKNPTVIVIQDKTSVPNNEYASVIESLARDYKGSVILYYGSQGYTSQRMLQQYGKNSSTLNLFAWCDINNNKHYWAIPEELSKETFKYYIDALITKWGQENNTIADIQFVGEWIGQIENYTVKVRINEDRSVRIKRVDNKTNENYYYSFDYVKSNGKSIVLINEPEEIAYFRGYYDGSNSHNVDDREKNYSYNVRYTDIIKLELEGEHIIIRDLSSIYEALGTTHKNEMIYDAERIANRKRSRFYLFNNLRLYKDGEW